MICQDLSSNGAVIAETQTLGPRTRLGSRYFADAFSWSTGSARPTHLEDMDRG